EAERGTAAAFVCKFHGWTYDLRGRLARPGRVGLPHALEQFMDDRALGALPCETRHGFVWVVATPRAALDVASALGPLEPIFASLDLESRELVSRTTEVRASSWKRIVEAYLEAGATLSLPSSLFTSDDEGVSHIAVFPRAVDESVVIHTRLARRSGTAHGTDELRLEGLDDPIRLFHESIDRAIGI
ncbi:MAG: hypothetical protein ABI321_07805, partial [Polyangia bacterium]